MAHPLRKFAEWIGWSDADVNEAQDAFEAEFLTQRIPESKKSNFKYLFCGEFDQTWDALLKNTNPVSEAEKEKIKNFLASSGNWLSGDYWQLYGRYLGYIIGCFRFKPEQILVEGGKFLIWLDILKRKNDSKEFIKFIKKKGLYWIWYITKTPELTNTRERRDIFKRLKAAIENL